MRLLHTTTNRSVVAWAACSLETVVPTNQVTTACRDSEDHIMKFHLYENLHVHESPMK